MLSFQKLDVYQRAIEFLALALEIISKLPKGHGRLAAQLRESAQSTVSNIAEGGPDVALGRMPAITTSWLAVLRWSRLLIWT
jgi:hypothetical protein